MNLILNQNSLQQDAGDNSKMGGLYQALGASRDSFKVTRKGSQNVSVVSGLLGASKSPNKHNRNMLGEALKSPKPLPSNPPFTPGNGVGALSNLTYNEDHSVGQSHNNMKVNLTAINKSIAAQQIMNYNINMPPNLKQMEKKDSGGNQSSKQQ